MRDMTKRELVESRVRLLLERSELCARIRDLEAENRTLREVVAARAGRRRSRRAVTAKGLPALLPLLTS